MTARRPERVSLGQLLFAMSSVAGTVAVGLAQPLLDLYGKNSAIFSAAKLTRTAIVEFALLVALGPAVAWAVVALPLLAAPRVFRLWQAVGIGTGAALTSLVLLRKADQSAAIAIAAAALALVIVAVAAHRFAPIRSVATLLGLLAPATIGLFLFASPVSRYVWGTPAKVAALNASEIAHRPPIIWIVFDETNIGLLLTSAGTIDAERYPNLAALAATSTWYRNAVGIDNFTPRAVPGLLSSRDGSGNATPTALDYPANAFSLLGGPYLVDAVEPVTDLCTGAYCHGVGGTSTRTRTSLASFLSDAAVVYGQIALPAEVASDLPDISAAWGGFNDDTAALQTPDADADTAAPSALSDDPLAKYKETIHGRGPDAQIAVAEAWLNRITTDERPTLHFLHLLLPHRPWALVPDGRPYNLDRTTAMVSNVPPPQPWRVRVRAARFALQAGAMDRVLGEVVAHLKAIGVWDPAFVVVSADHGVNFQPGAALRDPAPDGSLDELYRAPMLIKVPGQTAGVLSDAPVSTEDILPTLFGVLGVKASASFVGTDLGQPVAGDRARTVWFRGTGRAFESGTTSLFSRLKVYDGWFPNGAAGWERIFAVGPYASLLATNVPATTPAASGYRTTVLLPKVLQATPATAVSLVSVRVTTPDGAAPADGAVVVTAGDRIVGFLGGAIHDPAGWRVEGLIDWRPFDTPGATLGLYIAHGSGATTTLARLGP